MIPKKAADFKKPTAEELNLPEHVVNSIVDLYWKTVRKKMTSLSVKAIDIPNLGIFSVKHWIIDEEIETLKRIIQAKEGKFRQYGNKKDLEERIAAMEKIKAEVQEERSKFKIIRQDKYAKRLNQNMDQQSPDLEGTEEQNLQDRTCGEDISDENEGMQDMSGT